MSPRQAAGARYFAMDAGEDVGEAPAAERPAPLLEVLPQEWVQRRTVEQIVDPVPVVPMLHVFVPQMVEQLVDILAPLDFRVAEQVIDAPRIVCPPRAARTVLRAPQTVEQLVEVPTPVSFSSLLQRTVEQNIPVAGGGGAGGGLSGFLPGQNSAASWNRTVDTPSGGGFKVFNVDRVQQRFWSRSPCLQFLVEVFKIFSQSRVPQRLLRFLLDTLAKGFFALFPDEKSATLPARSWSALPPHSSPQTPAPYGVPMVLEEEEELDEAEEVEEVALAVEYVECDGRWWGQQWDPTAQQFCWWLAAADGSQLGHTIWRPPWDFG